MYALTHPLPVKHSEDQAAVRIPRHMPSVAVGGAKNHLEKKRIREAAYRARLKASGRKRSRTSSKGEYQRLSAEQKAVRAANARAWQKANPEKARAIKVAQRKKRLARKRGAMVSNIKSGDLRRLLAAQGGRCVYCLAVLDETKHLDHIMPIARGGAHVIENVQWLCAPCNVWKAAKLPSELRIADRRPPA